MHQNDERDSSSNTSVEDSSPDNSDEEEEEEEKVVSIVSLSLISCTCRGWFVDIVLFESIICCFSFSSPLNLLFLYFVGSFERRWVFSKVLQSPVLCYYIYTHTV